MKKSSLNCFVVRARGWVYVARGRPQCARTRTGVLSYPRGALWDGGGGGLDRQQHFWVLNTRVFILILFSYISNISDGAGGSDELGGGRGGSGVNHLYLSVCVCECEVYLHFQAKCVILHVLLKLCVCVCVSVTRCHNTSLHVVSLSGFIRNFHFWRLN